MALRLRKFRETFIGVLSKHDCVVTGENGKELAKNFDTTPTQTLIAQEPDRALVSDVTLILPNGGIATRG
jgi:hypothetical protein